ncbi:MAG TPA: HD domain-containing protein [Allosphingosinicella sp.]
MVLGTYLLSAPRSSNALKRASRTETRYSYQAPIGLKELAKIDPLFSRLAETRAFLRLKDIRFLGGIDFLLVPNPNGAEANQRYTRYQHSLGVAGLALLYCQIRDVPDAQRKLAYAAALLHDVGHGPLSHSLEPVFEEVFEINHHQATEEIILGRNPLGKELCAALMQSGVDPQAVVSVLEGQHDPFEGFFSGPINFDTIEGILRSRRYATRATIPISPVRVVQAATLRQSLNDREVVDSFWAYKDEVYKHVIRAPAGVLADFVCQETMRKNLGKLGRDDFFGTETTLFRKVPELRTLLADKRKLEAAGACATIKYKVREFTVQQSGDFFTRADKTRYVQRKWDSSLTLPPGQELLQPQGGMLFDDLSGVQSSEGVF